MTGSADCSVAWGTEYFGAGVPACFGAWGAECFGVTSLVALSAYCCPNLPCPLPHSCKWGNAVPMKNLPSPV